MRDDIFPMLVADAGNSAVKLALVKRHGGKPHPLAVLGHGDGRRLREVWNEVRPRSTFAASVVPAATSTLRRALPRVRLIGPGSPVNFDCAVDRRTLGADRLANMAEAARRFGRRVLVADFGTAATFDLLDAGGAFAGGAIAPGLRMLAGALEHGTAQLPATVLRAPLRFAGRNTAEALRAGVAGGYAGLVRHLVAQLGGRGTRLVFTGGDARAVSRLTGLAVVTDPLWTLRGIAVLGEVSAREGCK